MMPEYTAEPAQRFQKSDRPLLQLFATLFGAAVFACASNEEGDRASANALTPLPISARNLTICKSGDPIEQRKGTACLCCHTDDFGVAGTVQLDSTGTPSLDRILAVAENGERADMNPNQFGNFFRFIRLQGPLKVSAWTADGTQRTMKKLAPNGDCNRCHTLGGEAPPL
jgi:hypothetical protein